jgi:hypothetical protein
MPSKHPALSLTRFITRGSNLGCVLSTTQVRCVVVSRVWTAPAQPKACTAAWGGALVLSRTGLAQFACGGLSKPPSHATVIADGWDDTVGGFTCQVRSFGVNCFNLSDRRGLLVSRTGYTTY